MAAVVLSIIGLAITILCLVVAVIRYTTRIETYVKEMRPLVKRVPFHDYRLQLIETHLELRPPIFINGNGDRHED